MGNNKLGGLLRKSNESTRLICTILVGILIGYIFGISLPSSSNSQFYLLPWRASPIDMPYIDNSKPRNRISQFSRPSDKHASSASYKIYAKTNPHGAELLPPGIVVSETDLYLRRLWGDPNEDLTRKPKYLVAFAVGFDQSANIDAAIKKFSENFTILLFHYDGRTSEWEKYEWSKRAIHVSVKKQTKWWYAKRFLHPDVIAAYDYIFIWDEDLGVEHFDAEKYIQIIKKHGLEISQPGLEPNKGLTWEMTKRRGNSEVHKLTTEKPGWCTDPHLPPCAAFVEIMAPVFSRKAWRCVWHMIQNDLVHGWGLDFALQRCVESAHEQIGVVDSQWIVHQVIPSLGNQGESVNGKKPWQGVRERCKIEWTRFVARLTNAEKEYFTENAKG